MQYMKSLRDDHGFVKTALGPPTALLFLFGCGSLLSYSVIVYLFISASDLTIWEKVMMLTIRSNFVDKLALMLLLNPTLVVGLNQSNRSCLFIRISGGVLST